MPAVKPHKTETTDKPWDSEANEKRLKTPITKSTGPNFYAWYDPKGDDSDGDGVPDAKKDWKFGHHEVDENGKPGAANSNGCDAIIHNLNGAQNRPHIPDADRQGVYDHAASHLRDAGLTPAPLKGESDDGPIIRVSEGKFAHARGALITLINGNAWAIDAKYLDSLVYAVAVAQTAQDIAPLFSAVPKRIAGNAADPIAVINLAGPITPKSSVLSALCGTALTDFMSELSDAANNPKVQGIIMNVDSPGGMVDLVPEAAAAIRSARKSKPVVAIANTTAASAAYWLASQASELVVTQSGQVGSIGVYSAHTDFSGALAQKGQKTTLVSAGKYKVEGNSYEPLGEEAQAAMQDKVDTFYGMFTRDVAAGRGVPVSDVRDGYGQGRMLTAQAAKDAGMVDRIDTIDGVLSDMAKRIGRDEATRAAILREKAKFERSMFMAQGGEAVNK